MVGKKKEREEVYVYTQEGERKEIMEYADEFIGSWKNNIYQKAERPNRPVKMGVENVSKKKKNWACLETVLFSSLSGP